MSSVKARKQNAAEKQSATPLGFFIASHRIVHPSEAILPQSAPEHSSHPDSIFHLLDRVYVTHPYLRTSCQKCLITESHYREDWECWTHFLFDWEQHQLLMMFEEWASSIDRRKSDLQALHFGMGLVVMEDES